MKSPQHAVHSACGMYIKTPGKRMEKRLPGVLFMDFSLLSPLEFFVVPKNGDGRNNKPPAMRVRVDCYTKNHLSVYNRVVQAVLQKGKVIYGEERKFTCAYEMDVQISYRLHT